MIHVPTCRLRHAVGDRTHRPDVCECRKGGDDADVGVGRLAQKGHEVYREEVYPVDVDLEGQHSGQTREVDPLWLLRLKSSLRQVSRCSLLL
jgi:hypothetical protein